MQNLNFSPTLCWSLSFPFYLMLVINSHVFVRSISFSKTNYSNETDRLALLDLKSNLVDGPNGMLSSWNSSLHFCIWVGVSCSLRHQRVTVLNLTNQGLSGFISPSIGNLTFLRQIYFHDNKLQGVIPKEIGRLSRLEEIGMNRNSLEGEIPTDITNCSNLNYIAFSENNLMGNLPLSIGNLLNLQFLLLEKNNLVGAIPQSLSNLSNINILALNYNNFQGSIPGELGELKGLRELTLCCNNFSGTIPSSLYNLSSIRRLHLTNNSLFGTLEPNFGLSFPNLQQFVIARNHLTGPIPSTISNISGMQYLDLTHNNFTGKVPEGIGKLKQLIWLGLGLNTLGTGKNGDLSFLSSFSNASSLSVINMGANNFGGSIPNSITNVSNLVFLILGSNELQGSIPKEIGNLPNLVSLILSDNHFMGLIPSSIDKLVKLGYLDLSGNRLFGPIPFSIGNLTSLITLGMENNQLEGTIPVSLKSCSRLEHLILSDNRLGGRLPGESVGNLKNLIRLKLERNLLNGSFPGEVGNLKSVIEMSISDNKFSDQIPGEIGDCMSLEILRMDGNSFEGSVPQSLSALKGVRIIDLSRNNLSGEIPHQLEDLRGLENLNLSFNHLNGDVPVSGVFTNISIVSLNGNEGLCGGVSQLKFPLCSVQTRTNEKQLLSRKAKIVVIIVCIVFMVLVVSTFIIIFRRKAPKGNSSSAISMKSGYMRVTYKEILNGTEGFSSSNLIGAGSFGSVYKANLDKDKKPVAIKVINLERRGATQSFKAECKALSKIRHRNLVKIISVCSSVDFKGNDFLALAFELMPNGCLDKWLHESRPPSFAQRLDIAIDVASALEYLHNHCDPPIVHCDLKPQNVLLDEDMVAHVGDFGLARLLGNGNINYSGQDHTNSSTVKGSIGYIPPEYGMGEKVSLQGDVYSFGILLLEMITTKRPTDDMFIGYNMNLHTLVQRALPVRIREILDLCLLEEFEASDNNHANDSVNLICECLVSMAELGVACSSELPGERMTIADVLKELETIKKKLRG